MTNQYLLLRALRGLFYNRQLRLEPLHLRLQAPQFGFVSRRLCPLVPRYKSPFPVLLAPLVDVRLRNAQTSRCLSDAAVRPA